MSKQNRGVTILNLTRFPRDVGKFTALLTYHRRSDIIIYFGTTVQQMKAGMLKTRILPRKLVAMATYLSDRQIDAGFIKPLNSSNKRKKIDEDTFFSNF